MALRPIGIEDDNTFRGRADTALTQKIGDVVSPDMQKKLEALTVGTVTTGNAGTNASVTITGTAPTQTVNFTIPRGNTGATPTVGVGTVTTGAAGSSVSITEGGTATARTFNFTIPRGDKGETGAPGTTVHSELDNLTADDHTQYALADGSRGAFASPSHTHDDRYYTETEVNNLLINRPKVVVLNASDPVPAGLAEGTLIARID